MLKTYIEENINDVVFFRYSFRRFIYLSFFLLALNYCVLGMMFMKLMSVKASQNFATTSDGRLIDIFPE